MGRPGKKYREARGKVDSAKHYGLEEAVGLVKDTHFTRFDQTVEMAIRLGVDPRHADQMVRGSVVLPHGLGRSVRVVVFAKGEKEKEARDAGADYVGSDDLIKRITEENWLDFDKTIATPDMMSSVGKIGKILGPRGLMPSPKVGTVTFDVAKAVKEMKAGRVEFKVDRTGNLHVPVGKVSFDAAKLEENVVALLESIVRAKPSSSKGNYIRSITLACTMGPGVKIDPAVAVAKGI